MFTNISVLHIKKKLEEVRDLFDPSKSSYAVINNCITNDLTAYELLEGLKKIGNTGDYPVELQNFFSERFNELMVLAKMDYEIKQVLDKIAVKNRELEGEFQKRNVFYNGNVVDFRDYEKMTYLEKRDYLAKLDKDLLTFDNKIDAIKKEKSSGEEFDKNIGDRFDSDNNKRDCLGITGSKETVQNIGAELENQKAYVDDRQKWNRNSNFKVGKFDFVRVGNYNTLIVAILIVLVIFLIFAVVIFFDFHN